MTVTPLTTSVGNGPEFRRFTVTYADLTAAAVTESISLFTLSKGGKVLGVSIKHSVPFSGGALASMSVSVGVAGDVARYASAFDIWQVAADTTLQESTEFKHGQYAAIGVVAAFTGSANVNTATAGSVDIDVLYINVLTPL